MNAKLVKEVLEEYDNNLRSLYFYLKNKGIDVDSFSMDGFWVENKRGIRAYIVQSGDNYDILIQGDSHDLPIYDIEFSTVYDLLKSINKKWIKENFPE